MTEEEFHQFLFLLPEYRKEKTLRYRNYIDQLNCLISFLLLKILLKRKYDIIDFTMKYDKNGKPYLKEYPDIHISISHCKCACAVVISDSPVGIDVQEIRKYNYDIYQRVCSERELQQLMKSDNKEEFFTKIWCVKECMAKVSGMGIENYLKQECENNRGITVVRQVRNYRYVVAVCDN